MRNINIIANRYQKTRALYNVIYKNNTSIGNTSIYRLLRVEDTWKYSIVSIVSTHSFLVKYTI